MKVWYNKINESRRSMVEVPDAGGLDRPRPGQQRGAAKPAGFAAPRRGAAGRRPAAPGERGAQQLRGGRRGGAGRPDGRRSSRAPRSASGPSRSPSRPKRPPSSPAPNWKPTCARSWPTWSCGSTASCSSGSTCTSSRPIEAGDTESILLLENNIEDVCRELNVFGAENEAAAGRDHRPDAPRPPGQPVDHGDRRRGVLRPGRADHRTSSTCRPRWSPSARRSCTALLQFVRERLNLDECRDVSEQVHRVESGSTRSSTWSGRTCTTSCAST